MARNNTPELTQKALFFAMLVVTSKIVIPLPLLDYLSLQIIPVFLLYPLLGRKSGSEVILSYVILGVMGLPLFAAGGGLSYVLRPSFGFLIAFTLTPLLQSIFTKYFSRKNSGIFQQLIEVNYLSLLSIHLIGLLYKGMILVFLMPSTPIMFHLLTVTTLIDLACDALLVFMASVVTLRITQMHKKIRRVSDR